MNFDSDGDSGRQFPWKIVHPAGHVLFQEQQIHVTSFGKGSIKIAQHINASQLYMPRKHWEHSLPPRWPENTMPSRAPEFSFSTCSHQFQSRYCSLWPSQRERSARPRHSKNTVNLHITATIFRAARNAEPQPMQISKNAPCSTSTEVEVDCTNLTTSTAPQPDKTFHEEGRAGTWNGHFPGLIRKFHKSCPSSTSATPVQAWGWQNYKKIYSGLRLRRAAWGELPSIHQNQQWKRCPWQSKTIY